MWRDGSLRNGNDGMVYGTAGQKLFRVDPKTMDVKVLAQGADKVTVGGNGKLYTFGAPKTELFEVGLEGK